MKLIFGPIYVAIITVVIRARTFFVTFRVGHKVAWTINSRYFYETIRVVTFATRDAGIFTELEDVLVVWQREIEILTVAKRDEIFFVGRGFKLRLREN